MVSEQTVAVSPLKMLRVQRGWSLDEVVLRVRQKGGGLDRGELSRLERGLQILTEPKRDALAEVFGVPTAEVSNGFPSPTEAPPQEVSR